MKGSGQRTCWNLTPSETIVDWSSSTQSMGNRRVLTIWGRWCWTRTILKVCWPCKVISSLDLAQRGDPFQPSAHLRWVHSRSGQGYRCNYPASTSTAYCMRRVRSESNDLLDCTER